MSAQTPSLTFISTKPKIRSATRPFSPTFAAKAYLTMDQTAAAKPENQDQDQPLPTTVIYPGASYSAPSRSRYTPDLFEGVCQRIEQGGSLRRSCTDAGIPFSDFTYWVRCDAVLAARYARAKANLAHQQVSQALDCGRELRNFQEYAPKDYRFANAWATALARAAEIGFKAAEKLLPAEYGPKLQIGVDGDLAALMAEARARVEARRLAEQQAIDDNIIDIPQIEPMPKPEADS